MRADRGGNTGARVGLHRSGVPESIGGSEMILSKLRNFNTSLSVPATSWLWGDLESHNTSLSQVSPCVKWEHHPLIRAVGTLLNVHSLGYTW